MRNIKLIIITCLLFIASNRVWSSDLKFIEIKNQQQSLAEQVYNRLVISTRIVEYSNGYIDSIKITKPNVPNNIWDVVKQRIDYNSFKISVVQILNNNLTSQEMQTLIDEFSELPLIPIPTIKIKKEMHDLMPSFEVKLNEVITQVLSENGY
jgi:hypothetical protein